MIDTVHNFDPLTFIAKYKLPSRGESSKVQKRKQEEAEVIARAIQSSTNQIHSQFATKEYLGEEIRSTKIELKNKIDDVKVELEKR